MTTERPKQTRPTDAPSFQELLERAITEPGIISKAYSQFYGYSFGNQLLAYWQCSARQIQPGPIATYNKWQELGRQVRKGEKALQLCMPITVKKKADEPGDEDSAFTR